MHNQNSGADDVVAAKPTHHPLTRRDALFAALLLAVVAAVALVASDATAQPAAVEYRYDQVAQVRARPVAAAAEEECFTQALGAAAAHLLNTDLASGDRDEAHVQNVRVVDRHATQGVCVRIFDFATSCAATCAASGLTCNATAATDGDFIPPSMPYVIPIDGTECACGAATGAGTTTTTCRIHRDIQ